MAGERKYLVLSVKTYNRLTSRKIHPRQTFDEVINKMLDVAEKCEVMHGFKSGKEVKG